MIKPDFQKVILPIAMPTGPRRRSSQLGPHRVASASPILEKVEPS